MKNVINFYHFMSMIFMVRQVIGLLVNQPRFDSNATWNTAGVVLISNSSLNFWPKGLFVDRKDRLFLMNQRNNSLIMYDLTIANPSILYNTALSGSKSLFVTDDEQIFIDSDGQNGGLGRYTVNGTRLSSAIPFLIGCDGLFVTTYGDIYCSQSNHHHVVTVSLNGDMNKLTIVAGTGCAGSGSQQLNNPAGIFVKDNLDLYVADLTNDRIQLYQYGTNNATTVAGTGASYPMNMSLVRPVAVILDADGDLFIAEKGPGRIIRSNAYGSHCIISCNGSGPLNTVLREPMNLAFDSSGNLYVTDQALGEIKQFNLIHGLISGLSLTTTTITLTTSTTSMMMPSTTTTAPPPSNKSNSVNQPRLCSAASWNLNASTLTDNLTLGPRPRALFIDQIDRIYSFNTMYYQFLVWINGNSTPDRIFNSTLTSVNSLFVTNDKQLFVDNNCPFSQIHRFRLNGTRLMSPMPFYAECTGLFVTVNDDVYCSQKSRHYVVSSSLNDSTHRLTVIAGTGYNGNGMHQLNGPAGIFVTAQLDLYVADSDNNRIQLFRYGQVNGTTVAGATATGMGNITLNRPIAVVLDADGNLFILENGQSRIIRWNGTEFRCIVACTGTNGSANSQLNAPTSFAFDSLGNMFVMDYGNSRIQKFALLNDGCDATTAFQTGRLFSTSFDDFSIFSFHKSTSTATITSQSHLFSTTARLPSAQQTCTKISIKLTPSDSNLTAPLEFRRNQDFHFTSNIQIDCNPSLSLNTTWAIYVCTGNCSTLAQQVDPSIVLKSTDLSIPARTLSIGVYQLELTVVVGGSSNMTAKRSAYVRILQSGITVNLFYMGTSFITSSYQRELEMNPGIFSVDSDGYDFNASEWNYKYYCRIYGSSNFPSIAGVLLTIDDNRTDARNPHCVDNRSAIRYVGVNQSIQSAVIIPEYSLRVNRTYQFMVQLQNKFNGSSQATGYILVRVQDTDRPLIAITCVVSGMCIPNQEFQMVNPTTQIDLLSVCIAYCSNDRNISWNIYYGSNNASINYTQWTIFNQANWSADIWFYGKDSHRLTVFNKLFWDYPLLKLWRFEVVYSTDLLSGSSALDFLINEPPANGSCSINPHNGTVTTTFNISCPRWFDLDGIKSYEIYSSSSNSSEKKHLAFSSISAFQVQLTAGSWPNYSVDLFVLVRDTYDCVTQWNLTTVIVRPDTAAVEDIINGLSSSSTALAQNPLVHLLITGNQNTVTQVANSISEELNRLNDQNINYTISNGVSMSTVSVSLLGSSPHSSTSNSNSSKVSILTEYQEELDRQVITREYLVQFVTNLPINSMNTVKLQSSFWARFTAATNQMTRSLLTTTAEQCYQLAMNLNSFTNRAPFEDISMAVTQLLQCGANLLESVNRPLQQRTTVLNLDYTRANTLPSDYDTSLDLEWSNLNLFAEGDDFSSATIKAGRNKYYQRELAVQISKQVDGILNYLTAALTAHLNVGQSIQTSTPSAFLSLQTIPFTSISNLSILLPENARIHIPQDYINGNNRTTNVRVRATLNTLAPFGNSKQTMATEFSRTVSLTIFDENQTEIKLKTTNDDAFEIFISQDPTLILPEMKEENVTFTTNSSLNSFQNQYFFLHYVNISSLSNGSVHFEVRPLNISIGYFIIYRFDGSPVLTMTEQNIDGWATFCPSNLTNGTQDTYTFFISNRKTSGRRFVVFGIRELNSTEISTSCGSNASSNPLISDRMLSFTSNYEVRAYGACCYFLDDEQKWSWDGVWVGSLTSHRETQCFSRHLTTFSTGFVVLPEPINWNHVFSNGEFLKNKTIYLTVIFVFVMFICLMIYARFSDRKDLEKLGVSPLPDNKPTDRYHYQIIVLTGHRQDSGTKSKVQFILFGENGKTKVRMFADDKRAIFQRGSIDGFVMSVPRSLGKLNYLHVWHDNSGPAFSASWFVKSFIIRDLQTMETFDFICQQWLAIDKGDGQIERLIPLATESDKRQLRSIFFNESYYQLSEDHLWYSIFSRPLSNRFTRVQRCTCCFVLLFVSMMLNILYYDLSNETNSNHNSTLSLTFGSLTISSQEILIGLIVELLSILPSVCLVLLFRRIRTKSQENHRPPFSHRTNSWLKSKWNSWSLPHWFLYVNYGLCCALIGLSIVLILARGIEFGDDKAQRWLISMLSGFLSSIFFTQPIKVLCLSMFFAYVFTERNRSYEFEDPVKSNHLDMNNDETLLHESQINATGKQHQYSRLNRLTQEEIHFARLSRTRDVRMWSVVRESLIYFIFFTVLAVLTYSHRSENFFYQVNHLRRYLVHGTGTDGDLTKIVKISQYWNWLENHFVNKIHAQQWYNGNPPEHLRGFINDKTNRLIGWTTIRQVRIQSENCLNERIESICQHDYGSSNEEKRSFEVKWTNLTSKTTNSSVDRAFQYRTSEELESYIYIGQHGSYAGGGYVYELRGRLTEIQSHLSMLHQYGWLDSRTRAVIIQFSLYNPNTELFTAGFIVSEFLPTGGLESHARFQPISFYALTNTLQLISFIIYMILIFYFLLLQWRLAGQLKIRYLFCFWSYVELGLIACSWTIVGLYVWRYQQSQSIGQRFRETNGDTYINLQSITYCNEFIDFFIGYCCFFGTLRFLRLCQYQRDLSLFTTTLKRCFRELISFSLMFSFVVMAFLCLFYLNFASEFFEFSSVWQTAMTLFEMSLFNFNATEWMSNHGVLTATCFSLFVVLVVFICLNMFVSIITESFRSARRIKTDDDEIFLLIYQRFTQWIGWRKPAASEFYGAHDSRMRSNFVNPIEIFPEKVDQLLKAWNRLSEQYEIENAQTERLYKKWNVSPQVSV